MKSEDVIGWREALVRLSDQHFFDLMRMYLGAIKTPFNKQKLVEELSSFLRKKETRAGILLCLDEFDLMILSAIGELPSPTQQKIVSLFSGDRSFPEIYERILNLEERLVIYRKGDAENREYAINPYLADEIGPLAGLSVLVSPGQRGEPLSALLRVDDLALAALYSFFLHEGDAVKNDGSFRKKTMAALEAVFPQILAERDCLRFLLAAFQNLSLLVKVEGRLVPDPGRWQAFAKDSPLSRFAWLVAAAGGRLPRELLRERAQTFIDFYAALEDGSRYQRDMVSRLAFLLSEKSGRATAGRPGGRFSAMIREQETAVSAEVGKERPDMISVAKAFGLLVEADGCLVKNSILPDSSARDVAVPGARPYLVVSPSLDVTLMPGFSLAELLPLALCMEVRDVQIAGQFEITRKSCAAAFDQGVTADELVSLFRSRSAQALPQIVEFSIDDWFRSYSSVSLYHGFILRVDENRRVLFENDEYLSSLIRKILAPGIYLLDADSPEEIQESFARADLDFLPSVNSPLPKREAVDLPSLRAASLSPLAGKSSAGASRDSLNQIAPHVSVEQRESPERREADFDRHREKMLASLDSLAFPPEIDEALRSRIERRIVLNPAQLDGESVRIEKVEARGMDFLGKVRIAEYALVSGSLLEIVLEEKDSDRHLLGRPVSTEKRTGDVLLKLVTEPDKHIELISLGKAVLVRRIRGSIFSELPQGRN